MGLTFKENCPDVRNTKVVDVIETLRGFNATIDVWDPWVDAAEAEHEFGLKVLDEAPAPGSYDAVVLAVGHRQFAELGPEAIRALGKPESVFFDVKSVFDRDASSGRI
jgi:UDP-N-acetyl-D-galactosamine dehydrogenase